MKKSIFSLAFTALLLSSSFAAFAQEPCNPEPCTTPQYCAPAQNCDYVNCDQQPLLDQYTALANKYKEYGENGRRAEQAKGNQEVQQLYTLKNHFQNNVPASALTTDQQLQLQAADSCMM